MQAWLSSTLQRQYLTGGPKPNRPLDIVAARGERVSFQACIYYEGMEFSQVKASGYSQWIMYKEWLPVNAGKVYDERLSERGKRN